MNPTTRRILTTLAHARDQGLTGLGIQDKTGLGVGTSYPHLVRLVTAGLVTRTQQPALPGTPRHTVYRVTDLGRAEARQLHLLPPPRTNRWALPARWSAVLRRTGATVNDGDTLAPNAFTTSWPHPVLVRNQLLGGTMHRPFDREETKRLRELDPHIGVRATAIEADRERVLRALADRGLAEQVLDLTTGVPAREVVRSAHVALATIDPPVPVVYVVTDDLLAVATTDLVSTRHHVKAVIANPCDSRSVWQAVTAFDSVRSERLMHPGRPIVLDAVGISDLVPDPRRLRTLLRQWHDTVPAGSVLLLGLPLDPALPDPFPLALGAGWHPLPGMATPPRDSTAAFGYRAHVVALTSRRSRWPRRSMQIALQ